jgi:hypothetical protein
MEGTDALGAAAREVRPRARSRKLQAESSNKIGAHYNDR